MAVICGFIGNLVYTGAVVIAGGAATAALASKYQNDADKGIVAFVVGSLFFNIIISGYFYKVMIKYAA